MTGEKGVKLGLLWRKKNFPTTVNSTDKSLQVFKLAFLLTRM